MPGWTAATESEVAQAIGRVLDVDPGVVRADTPLADLGADAVALLAVVAALRQAGVPVPADQPSVVDALRTARTAGDVMAAVEARAPAAPAGDPAGELS